MKIGKDLKIQSQGSKSKAKYEVGNFCTQYGLPPIAPSKKKSKIENRSPTTSKRMISIRKERNPHPRHQKNASTVEREVILGKSVEIRPNPLSTL